MLDGGEQVVQATLAFDPDRGRTAPMRTKEEAHDYRYFPEPDLRPSARRPRASRGAAPSCPSRPVRRRPRYVQPLGLSARSTPTRCSEAPELADYFEATVAVPAWTRSRPPTGFAASCAPQLREPGEEPWESRATPERLAELIGLVDDRTLTMPLAKEVLADVAAPAPEPRAWWRRRAREISDEGELIGLVERLAGGHPDQAEQLRGGKEKVGRLLRGPGDEGLGRPRRPRP